MTQATSITESRSKDYSLVGKDTARAIELGLAEARWYASYVSREDMRELLRRRDGPAIRDTILWFGLLIATGTLGYLWWGSWLAILPFAVYSVIYATTSDSRWHESLHGTAFKTDWLNNALYEIASFMVLRESVPWRWSHIRHHSDTIIVGRDPEIAVPRPPDLWTLALSFFNLKTIPKYAKSVLEHCVGKISPAERTYIPATEFPKVYFRARIYALIYGSVLALAFYQRSWLPLMYIGLPSLWGAWLMPIYGYTQHAGLAENVLDHRLNCRTVYMNPINRFLYWNMNYHVEHHMFPLVPYHALPRLHELVKADMPKAYDGLLDAWREIIPAVLRQVKDPGYYVQRPIPMPPTRRDIPKAEVIDGNGRAITDGWIEVCDHDHLGFEEVAHFDYEEITCAIYHTADGKYYATDGLCTHGKTHLATGWLKGHLIECPKHNGRFDITDGSPQRKPVCIGLKSYPVQVRDGKVFLNIKDSNTKVLQHATQSQ